MRDLQEILLAFVGVAFATIIVANVAMGCADYIRGKRDNDSMRKP